MTKWISKKESGDVRHIPLDSRKSKNLMYNDKTYDVKEEYRKILAGEKVVPLNEWVRIYNALHGQSLQVEKLEEDNHEKTVLWKVTVEGNTMKLADFDTFLKGVALSSPGDNITIFNDRLVMYIKQPKNIQDI